MKKGLVLLTVCSFFLTARSQERLQPGKIYNAGTPIYAPLVGLKARVPEGWFGTLPQGEEVFLLIPTTSQTGYMFINAHKQPLSDFPERWKQTFSLTDAITITLKDEPQIKDGKLCAEFDVMGTAEPAVAYAEALPGKEGFTIVFILLSPLKDYESFRKDFSVLVNSAALEEPTIGDKYGDLVWGAFLQNKHLMSYISAGHQREKNEVWLCVDGTFRSKIKAGKLASELKRQYRGTNKGTWRAEGTGKNGQLYLTFNSKEPLTLEMEISDDKIFLNGSRYFILENTTCK